MKATIQFDMSVKCATMTPDTFRTLVLAMMKIMHDETNGKVEFTTPQVSMEADEC